ncbi:6-methylsalicylic acid synthase [Colletotrichum tabaci]|uniref:6-methylsalicylic acid synthase n=1 Tax=Colletotrichum tabaci TaxID=1209068 RepID=A0AAV9TSR3_9PEZI
MLTAASPSNVKANGLAVASALCLQDRPSPVDAAFTLSEKRERHAFRIVMTVANDVNQMVQKLEESVAIQAEAAASVTEIPAKPRNVVLVFGGQSRRAFHLDRPLYETNSRLREHIDECHKVVLELGYGPILPAIFDRHHDAGSSLSSQDVVVLQLALFLINYSCPVDAVIGHSLGELVALVFSGALSLRQGVQAVALRAFLMKSCWTGERGTMLAIHATEPVLTELLAAVQGGLEIACYNSASSHVVVGTAAEVVAAEMFLSKSYPSIKHQRDDTTHGFHSRFTEVLVPGLWDLEVSLDYKELWIPLEPCVRRDDDGLPDSGSGPVVSSGHIARHVRDPVFFGDAVQRIEKRLGSCSWLEAGFDSPVIPMVKRAVANAERHSFHPMRIHDAAADIDVAISNAFVKTEEDAERIRMLENKLQTLLPNVKQTSSFGGPDTPRLLTPHSRERFRYTVDTGCKRFRKIVSSHSVRGRHLCPASLYLEYVTMALKMVDYDSLLRGLNAMNLYRSSFSGVIKILKPPLAPEESSVLDIADTCVVDNIVQLLGLAINTGYHCGPGDVCLFSSCESFTLSSLCRLDSLESPAEFDVVGSFIEADDRLCEGDIYLLSGGKFAATVLGARFNRLPIKRIKAMLDRLTPAKQNNQQVTDDNNNNNNNNNLLVAQSPLRVIPSVDTSWGLTPVDNTDKSLPSGLQRVRNINSLHSGTPVERVDVSETLMNLGVDYRRDPR